MDTNLESQLLKSEIVILLQEIEARGTEISIPHSPDDLGSLSLSDLRQLKRELRDLVRTLGGNR